MTMMIMFVQLNAYGDLISQDFDKETISIEFPHSSFIRYVEDGLEHSHIKEKPCYVISSSEESWDRDDLRSGKIINEFMGFYPSIPHLNAKKEFKKILSDLKAAHKYKMLKLIDKKIYKIDNTWYLYVFVEHFPPYQFDDKKFYMKATCIITPNNCYQLVTNFCGSESDKDNHEIFVNTLTITAKTSD